MYIGCWSEHLSSAAFWCISLANTEVGLNFVKYTFCRIILNQTAWRSERDLYFSYHVPLLYNATSLWNYVSWFWIRCWVDADQNNIFVVIFEVDTWQKMLSSVISEMKHAHRGTDTTFSFCVHFVQFMQRLREKHRPKLCTDSRQTALHKSEAVYIVCWTPGVLVCGPEYSSAGPVI
jgi:hypothetical protein